MQTFVGAMGRRPTQATFRLVSGRNIIVMPTTKEAAALLARLLIHFRTRRAFDRSGDSVAHEDGDAAAEESGD